MGSYCPICDEFVENLDQCDLPYGGAPAPPYNNTAIQDDEADDNEYLDDQIQRARTIIHPKNFVKADNHLWEIDVDSDDTGLFRQNAMTFYQAMTPYLVLARDFNTQERLFFLVKVKNHPQNWLKIDLDRGDNLYNIKQIK